jgi:hypothetical protein
MVALIESSNWRDANTLSQSRDQGQSWQTLGVRVSGMSPGEIQDIDVDGNKIYLGTDNGLAVSGGGGNSFEWIFQWGWDSVCSIDFQDGSGWGWIDNWGSRSGLFSVTPNGSFQDLTAPINPGSQKVFADRLDPRHIGYLAAGYVTLDGGQTWTMTTHSIAFVGRFGSQPLICSGTYYSVDRGGTWSSLGAPGNSDHKLVGSPDGNMLFGNYGQSGVIAGIPGGPWKSLGLAGETIKYLYVGQDKLWAVTGDGYIFTASIAEIAQRFNE